MAILSQIEPIYIYIYCNNSFVVLYNLISE